MKTIFSEKLKHGDEIRVIAPARSLGVVSKELQDNANSYFAKLGFKLSFGKHVNESDSFNSSSIESRVKDLHDAFNDKNVKAIITVLGGFNSNQILPYIDWKIIKKNPKILCGFSDITILNNSIFSQTGLVTYSGPHYSTFGQEKYLEYTADYFKKCLYQNESFEILPSEEWTDDKWWRDQKIRNPIKNEGYWIMNEGIAEGTILGANLCTFGLLRGTKYFPNLKNSILFLEDDDTENGSFLVEFDRNLTAVLQQSDFKKVKGIVLGRFNKISNFSKEKLVEILKSKKELENIPIVANVDFGHTDPKITFPVGGLVRIEVKTDIAKIIILKH